MRLAPRRSEHEMKNAKRTRESIEAWQRTRGAGGMQPVRDCGTGLSTRRLARDNTAIRSIFTKGMIGGIGTVTMAMMPGDATKRLPPAASCSQEPRQA